MRFAFHKMHGLGNDFIVIDDLAKSADGLTPLDPEVAQKICDRRFGIGADQVLWLKKPQSAKKADARMEILNADGSVAEMCGNGIRAVALYLSGRKGKPRKPKYQIETLAGLLTVEVRGELVAVDMGVPVLGGDSPIKGEALEVSGQQVRFYEVSTGNPHAVIFVKDVNQVPIYTQGPAIEKHRRFPKRTNVEYVQVKGPHAIEVKVWERGAGTTLACGTGACASAVATIATGRAKSPLKVTLPGGDLEIAWEGPGKSVMMAGPATEVFRGIYTDGED